MKSRRIPLLIGLVLALGTGLLMLNFLSQVRAVAAAPPATRAVVVTTRELGARVPIPLDALTVVQRRANEVDPDALADPRAARGKLTLITIPAGSTVTRAKIGTAPELSLPTRLGRGLRAVSISIDRVKGVSGLIQPGDRIDVIAVPPRVGNETPRATTILRGALVLAMGSQTELAGATPAPESANVTTVTLAVTPPQADLLALADVDTTLRLALRAPSEPVRAYPTEALVLGTAPHPAAAPGIAYAPAAAPAAAAAPAPATPARARSHRGITIIDGDRTLDGTSTGKE